MCQLVDQDQVRQPELISGVRLIIGVPSVEVYLLPLVDVRVPQVVLCEE